MIRLEMAGHPGISTDSILIRGMGNAQSRIESLALLSSSGSATRIDLQSVFDQSTSLPGRFNALPSASQYGFLSSPV